MSTSNFLLISVTSYFFLAAPDLTTLVHDLGTILDVNMNKDDQDRDAHVKFVSDQLNTIFTRAHLDGIKAVLDTMKSPLSIALRAFIDRIENSLRMKLSDHDSIIIESYIHDCVASLVLIVIFHLIVSIV